MKFHLHLKHEWRHALQAGLAVAAAIALGHYLDPKNVVWTVLGALIVIQTSRGTPARQGLHTLFTSIVAVIVAFAISKYITQLEIFMIIMMGTIFLCTLFLMINPPERYQVMLQRLLSPLLMLVAVLWPAANEMALTHRILLVLAGGGLGIAATLVILPVMPYWEFQRGLRPILDALIRYSNELEKYILSDRAVGKTLESRLLKIENVLRSRRNEYPEWVFETGFNRNLRSSFRYVLVQIERVTDAFFSLDYHARQTMDAELFSELAPAFAVVLKKNVELLQVIRAFFAEEKIPYEAENFTSDITVVQQALRGVLPASIELLDLSPDYVNLAALARDAIDIRELLLQIITGLPMDELAVTE